MVPRSPSLLLSNMITPAQRKQMPQLSKIAPSPSPEWREALWTRRQPFTQHHHSLRKSRWCTWSRNLLPQGIGECSLRRLQRNGTNEIKQIEQHDVRCHRQTSRCWSQSNRTLRIPLAPCLGQGKPSPEHLSV